MNLLEYETLKSLEAEKERVICVDDLKPHLKERTLLYGFTCERETFHVYLKNDEIHIVVYHNDYSGDVAKPKCMREITATSNYSFVPDKRLYPEACDYKFCKLLKSRDIYLPFTTWNENRETKDFYGFTLEDTK